MAVVVVVEEAAVTDPQLCCCTISIHETNAFSVQRSPPASVRPHAHTHSPTCVAVTDGKDEQKFLEVMNHVPVCLN